MRGFRLRKGGAPHNLPPVMAMPPPTQAILCASCGEPIDWGSEKWFSLSRYDGNRFRWTRELHWTCVGMYAAEQGDDQEGDQDG